MFSGMMNTSPGGENTQYESIETVTKPHSKDGGQLGDEETQPDAVPSQQEEAKAEKGERTAANMRYGQAISEQGMGGKTTTSSGNANQAGFGSTSAGSGQDNAEETRREQGYGEGSGIGA